MNLQLQGRHVNRLQMQTKVKSLKMKLTFLLRDIEKKEFNYLPTLRDFIQENDITLPVELVNEVKLHCNNLTEKLSQCFPENYDADIWISNPFLPISLDWNLTFEERDELIGLSSDTALKKSFNKTTLEKFWCGQEIFARGMYNY